MSENAGSIYSEVRILLDKLTGDVKNVNANFDQINKNSKENSTAVEKNWKSSFKETGLAGVAAFAAISLAAKKAISVFGEFEQSMSNVQSVARGTPAEFKALEEAALDAGETTRFTASQAADALYYLASAGLSAKDSVSALSGVLELAGATGSDLAFTSATMTATLAQFGLQAQESGRVANVFAAAIAGSQANMEKLSTSLRYVGPIAAGFGMSIEQTVGALEGLYNAGFQGEQAGAALRNILGDLSDETGPVIKRLEALGIAFNEVTPETNGLADIIDRLNQSGISTAETLSTFGDRAGPIMATLLKQGGDSVRAFTADITGTNAAAEAYAIQNDTLKGSIDKFKSAVESAAIKTVKELAPALRAIIDIGTKVVKFFTGLPGPLKAALAVFALGIPIITAVSFAFTTLAGIIGTIGLPIIAIVGAVSLLTFGLVALNNTTSSAVKRQEALQAATDKLQKSIQDYEENSKNLKKAIADGNEVEKETLQLRQDLLKTQIAMDLKSTIKEMQALEREEKKQIERVNKLKKEYDDVRGYVRKYDQALQDQIRSGKSNSETAAYYRDRLKEINISVQDVTERLNEQKLALDGSTLKRQEAIDTLANYLVSGQIELSQLSTLNKDIAAEVFLRSKQIKEQKKLNETKNEGVEGDEDELEVRGDLEKANEKALDSIKKRKEEIENLNATEEERIQLDRERAIAEIKNIGASNQITSDAIKTINELYDAKLKKLEADKLEAEQQEKLKEATKKFNDALAESKRKHQEVVEAAKDRAAAVEAANKTAGDTETEYKQKLETLKATEIELLELQRQRAIATVEASKANSDAQSQAIAAINEYYDTLRDNTANEEFLENLTMIWDTVLSKVQGVFGAIGELSRVSAENRIADIREQLQAELEAAGLAEETNIERLNREIEEAKDAGDTERVIELENALEKEKIEQKYQKKIAEVQYQAALQEWRLKGLLLLADTAAAITKAIASAPFPLNLPAIGFATLESGIQAASLSASKPTPPSFQTGGLVLPSGSSSGTDIRVAENNSAEMMLNSGASGEPFLNYFADKIANKVNQTGAMFTIIQYGQNNKEIARETVNILNGGILQLEPRAIKAK